MLNIFSKYYLSYYKNDLVALVFASIFKRLKNQSKLTKISMLFINSFKTISG